MEHDITTRPPASLATTNSNWNATTPTAGAAPSAHAAPPFGWPPAVVEGRTPLTKSAMRSVGAETLPLGEPDVDASGAGLPYHRLAHVTPGSGRWWRPIVMAPAFVVAAAVVALVTAMFVWGVLAVFPEIPSPTDTLDDPRNPADIAYSFGSLALLLPAVWLMMRMASGRMGTLSSVFGFFRWEFMWRAMAVTLPVLAVINGASFFADRPSDFSVPPLDGRLLAVIAATVVLVPFQAAAEEYVFRGLLPQMVGTWLRAPIWGALVSVPLFVLGHGYDAWGLVDIGVFALCAMYLAWKSGGLELPIVMHVANNLTLMLLAPFSPSSMHQGAVEPTSVLVSVMMTLALTAGLSRYASNTYGLARFEPLVRPRNIAAV